MRVSLAPSVRPPASGGECPAHPLLHPQGARVILGGHVAENGLSESIIPDASKLFGPRGACLAAPEGPLFVCDTGHHRLMVWNRVPTLDGAPADFLIGHDDFSKEGRNSKGAVSATTLNVPTGVAAKGNVLAVADAWNHRVLIWHGYPTHAQQPADVVLGQADFCSGLANRGGEPAAETLNWCYGVTIANGKLVVCDSGNRRVLIWNAIPKQNGQKADVVLGQVAFTQRDDSAGGVDAVGMRWPHAADVTTEGCLAVADAGRNRIMLWEKTPQSNGAPCDRVLGQADFAGQDANRAHYGPSAASVNMPYGIAAMGQEFLIADTANSRLLGWPSQQADMANSLAGQFHFTDKGDNRWQQATRDSICWPYGVSVCGSTAVIADSGNNRVLLWDKTP